MVGVYGLVGLGLLWLLERSEGTQRRFLAWLTEAAKRWVRRSTQRLQGLIKNGRTPYQALVEELPVEEGEASPDPIEAA